MLQQIVFPESSQAFWDYGIGAVCWNVRGQSLLLLIPCSDCPHGYEVNRVFCRHEPGNWAKSGTDLGWNGNLEIPSLRPSIRIPNRHDENKSDIWHGYLLNGVLTEQEPEDWSLFGF